MDTDDLTPERRDLLDALTTQRDLLRRTARDLTDEQALLAPTASALSVGGIIKHVAATERSWARFMVTGVQGDTPDGVDWSNPPPEALRAYEEGFRLLDGETLDGVLAEYDRIAAATDALVATLDLDRSCPLPPAPWFAPGAERSVRRAIVHVIAETAQHAGHADIIRESIDGAKTMG